MTQKEVSRQTSFKGLFQALIPISDGIMQGEVISVSPLKIQMLNDDKLIITENIAIVPRHLTDYHTVVDIELEPENSEIDSETTTSGSHTHSYSGTTDTAGDPPHDHNYSGETASSLHSHDIDTFNIYRAKMTVYNALKVGEKVHVLSINNGKKYYVLDRV